MLHCYENIYSKSVNLRP